MPGYVGRFCEQVQSVDLSARYYARLLVALKCCIVKFNLKRMLKIRSGATWFTAFFVSALTTGCDWVDSTGAQADANNVVILDQTLVNQSTGNIRSQALLEFSQHTLSAIDSESSIDSVVGWNWGAPYQTGALPECEQYDGFDRQLAARTLSGACASNTQCELGFNQRQLNGDTVFDILVPALRAPVGLSYQLKALNGSGDNTSNFITLCLISVNEAPIALNDQFTLVQDTTLQVAASNTVHLLSNDQDDNDVRNLPLRVNPIPIRAPNHAASFSLGVDGSFSYTPISGAQILNDNFVYQITDGQHTATATVDLRFVNENNAPLLVARIPALELVVDRPIDPDDARYNLSAYFRDPDGHSLQFFVQPDSLPRSGNIVLAPNGQLLGTPTEDDMGDFIVTVIATDGELNTTETFTLSIVSSSQDSNTPPTIKQLSDVSVPLGALVNITVEASDSDNDELNFSLANSAPDFLSISENSGIISGRSTTAGIYSVTVFVSDLVTLSSMTFELEISEHNNRPPVADDINNRRVSGSFVYDVSVFFRDPDGDELSFDSDRLPSGLTLSVDGLLRGVESSKNRGDHIISVTANDPFGATVSDRFKLTID